MTDDALMPKIRVAFKEVPDEIVAGVHAAPGAAALIFAPPGELADVEVRARQAVDGHAGWVVVKSRSTAAPLSPNDVIAYADPAPAPFAFGEEQLGPGLVHWARYRAIQIWPRTDARLQGAVRLDVLVAPDPTPRRPISGGIEVHENERILLHVTVASTSPAALYLALLVCSDDGNIHLLWPPPQGDNRLQRGAEKTVGWQGARPFRLTRRPDQTASAYTVKLVAAPQPFNPAAFELGSTVQDFFGESHASAAAPPLPAIAGATVAVPLEVTPTPDPATQSSYYADLTLYTYEADEAVRALYKSWPQKPEAGTPRVLNVGWLDSKHPYPQGPVPEEFVGRLGEFCRVMVNRMRGFNGCELCDPASTNYNLTIPAPVIVECAGRQLALGSAEIRVLGPARTIYAAPNLIYHYVTAHNYRPPEEFVSAVLEGPGPGTPEYDAVVQQHNWL